MPCFTIKHHPFFFQVQLKKVRYAYGISSKDISCNGRHILLFDCDSKPDFDWFTRRFREPIAMYPTPHGWHIVVWHSCSFHEAISHLAACPYGDKNHLAIGIKRGYWFLETYIPLFFKDLTYMRIERI